MTPKQERFCEEYLVDLNGTQAYIRAGYSVKTAEKNAARLMGKEGIQARIAELRVEQQKRTQITADQVIEELRRIGLARIDQVVACNGRSVTIKDFSEVPPEILAAVHSVEKTKDGIKIRFYNKIPALEQLMRHLGMFEKDNAQQAQMVLVAPVVRLTEDDRQGNSQSGRHPESASDAGLEGSG